MALCILGGWTAAGWFAALIWALWLQRTSIVDAVILPSSNPDEKLSKLSSDLLGINNSRNETKMSELRILEQFTS